MVIRWLIEYLELARRQIPLILFLVSSIKRTFQRTRTIRPMRTGGLNRCPSDGET